MVGREPAALLLEEPLAPVAAELLAPEPEELAAPDVAAVLLVAAVGVVIAAWEEEGVDMAPDVAVPEWLAAAVPEEWLEAAPEVLEAAPEAELELPAPRLLQRSLPAWMAWVASAGEHFC